MARSLPVENLLPQNACGFNYQLLAVIYSSSPMGSSQLQSTTTSYGQWRQRRQIQLTGRTSHPTGQYPLSSTYCTVQCGLQITKLTARRRFLLTVWLWKQSVINCVTVEIVVHVLCDCAVSRGHPMLTVVACAVVAGVRNFPSPPSVASQRDCTSGTCVY